MPDYGFIAQPQQQDSFKRIGEMLGVARGATELQKSRATMEADIAQRKSESEKAGIETGVARETAAPRISTAQSTAKSAETAAAHARFKLEGDQATTGLNEAAGLFKDLRIVNSDPEGTVTALAEARDRMIAKGVPKEKAEWLTSSLMAQAHNPGAVYRSLQNVIQANAGAGTQAGVVNAPLSVLSTGATLQPFQPQPGAPGGAGPQGAAIPVTMGPGAVETTERGPDGNTYIVQRSPQGTILNTRPLSQAGAPRGGAGGPPRMPSYTPEDQVTRPVLEGERTVARNVLSSAPISHETNRGILRELDNAIATGTPGPALAKLSSVLGLKWGTAEEKASSYDLIGKFTERNALEAAKAMGPGTNAGLEAAIKANGSAAYNPTALKKITKLNDAIVSGAEAYQPGLEKAIAANPERGVLVKREFDQAWAQNFDPRIMEIANAAKAKDAKAIDDILKQVGGRGSAGANELIKKARAIESLSTMGRLP